MTRRGRAEGLRVSSFLCAVFIRVLTYRLLSFTTRHDDIHGLHELLYCATRTHVFVSIINAPPLPVPARCVIDLPGSLGAHRGA